MTVSDVRNKRVLWAATESVKFAMKEKAKENNLVEAAERLASKFHERLEPSPPDKVNSSFVQMFLCRKAFFQNELQKK